MSDLTAYITTYNCARELPSTTHLSNSLFSVSNVTLPPDLIVLCLQEIAPIGYSFLGGSYLAPYFSRFSKVVQDAASKKFEPGVEYSTLLARNVGMTGLMIFTRSEFKDKIEWIETAGVGVGVWDMGNKGAVGARLGLESRKGEVVPVTFVSAHLAPAEGEWERRNADWRSICEGLVFTRERFVDGRKGGPEAQPLLAEASEDNGEGGGHHGLFDPYSHVFFAGDLNYRTSDLPPHPDDYQTWPHTDNTSALNELFARDQLVRELNAKNTLHLLAEHPISFPPTYKYSIVARRQAEKYNGLETKPSSEQSIQLWPKHRVPSWCDRILYLASSPPSIRGYDALPVQPTSDHRPVSLYFSMRLQPASSTDVRPPFQISRDWQQRRAAARRYEILVGVASYLALTWEGEALLAGTIVGVIGGCIALHALLAN